MRNKISRYEENQVDRFLYDLYLLWGGNLDEDMCIGEGWIVCLFFRKLKYWKNADIICGRLERKNRFLSVIHQWIKRRWK